MAKKKKKKLLPMIISIIVVIVIIVAAVFTFLLLKTPNAEKLAEKYKSEEYIAPFLGDEKTDVGAITGVGLKGAFVITFFEKTEDAKKAVETGKDALGEKVAIRRGRAVFVGTEDASKIFKSFLG